MTDDRKDTKNEGLAAKMKKLLGGGCGGGCCCGDVRIVSKEPEKENSRDDR
ncbi:MAG: hypothetical protein GKC04_07010 [Methanomicrobiales archaeon]|nr:hypothetical protein [Methanomicrobiales archaeon]